LPRPLDRVKPLLKASDSKVSNEELTDLKGVGPALKDKLAKLNINKQSDLLFLLPTRYEDRTKLKEIGSLVPEEEALIEGKVLVCNIVYGGRRMMLAQLSDDTGILTMRFFTFSKYQARNLSRDTVVRCYGKTRKTSSGIEMIHPQYQVINPESPAPLSTRLTPVYPTTKGLSQTKLRQVVDLGLKQQLKNTEEILPEEIITEMGLGTLKDALSKIHNPLPSEHNTDERFDPLRRLVAEELIANQLALRQIKRTTRSNPAVALKDNSTMKKFMGSLPFELTKSQKRVVGEIEADLGKSTPMMRLLQGDVSSGKTVVAASAMAIASASGSQSVLMAPTELLAEQHKNNLDGWFKPLGLKVVMLKSKLPKKEKELILDQIKNGEASIIIGTHALFQTQVDYKNLGLVVVDEQHRFGVEQRLSLVNKSKSQGTVPHQLIMTATPIPRTLAMTAYGDLDTSVLDELPKGRGSIKTILISDNRRDEVIEKIDKETKKGRQVYWVCPLIEESEELNYEAAETTFEKLKHSLHLDIDLEIDLVHGRLKPEEKNRKMVDFKNNIIQVLVATTVIEVGVDVPNATIMVIENSERLGLSQLHQLRGRVGRGVHESLCILIYKKPLNELAKKRLGVIKKSVDGFYISEKDLQLRGPGELLGTRQKGLIGLKIADISRDAHMLPYINKLCADFDNKYPDKAEKLIRRWIGEQIIYRNV